MPSETRLPLSVVVRKRIVFAVFAACLCFSFFRPPLLYALKVRPHPIEDLIEGDERTPPEGEFIVEERAATPAYPLPNMPSFAEESAIETFPPSAKVDKTKEAASEFEDEWSEWSSWDEWSNLDEWENWGDSEASESSASSAQKGEQPASGDQEPSATGSAKSEKPWGKEEN